MSAKRMVLIACSAWFALFSSHAAENISESLSLEKSELTWSFRGQKVLVLCFSTNLLKPYVRELYTLKGDNVLRDSPPDHLHHHGLMYAIRVNGVNFWEEKTDPGYEKTVQVIDHKISRTRKNLPQATCTLKIHWVAPKDRSAPDSLEHTLLIEQRTLTLTVNDKNNEVAVQWNGSFEVGRGAAKIKLEGTDYNGLGMRLPTGFDQVGQFQNSESAPYPGLPGEPTRNAIAANWSSILGQIKERDVTVTIFGAPDNKSGNHFFSLLQPFAYSGVTQALDKQALEYNPGDQFQVNFLVTIDSEKKSPEFLNRRYDDWRAEVSK